ncbi:MAG: serine/threonine protein kinase [Bacteroidales bacterium]|nr:serine/threonine protein kinase [Bacteroidales bacterium]
MQYTEGYLLDKRYLLKKFIGSGSFGEVWVAHDQETDLEVATKIYIAMDEKGLEEFKKEFQLSFELNHTNLLHANYLGVNSEDRRPYLVMPYCPDGSVSRYAANMEEIDLWKFIHDVAAGLAYLHAQDPPIIHQDIKPDNILILKNGDYVITDFGISKQLRASMRRSSMQLNSAGAISYMGPERFSKQFQAVKASDIWSLGASIYELATGDVPFCGMGGSLQKQGADMPELPDAYSERLNMVCASCMAKETWDRPTAAQLRDYAGQVIDQRPAIVTWHVEEQPAEAPAPAPVPKSTVMVTEIPEEPAPAPEEPQSPAAPLPKSTVMMVEEPVEEPVAEPAPVEPAPAEPAPVEPEQSVAGTVRLDAPEAAPAPEPAPAEPIGVVDVESSGPDNIAAPEKSGFVKTNAAVSSAPVLNPVVLIVIILLGLAAGVAAGRILL